jgi:U32 family peptidase
MKILTTIYDLNQLKKLSVYADGFLVGNDQFGTRLTKSFSIEEIKEITQEVKTLKKELFLQVNQIFNDDQLDELIQFLHKLPIQDITGIVVADLGALKTIEKLGFSDKAIYNPETLMTNIYDFNFLADFNIQGVYVAKEITLDDVMYIAKNKKYKMFMVGHGHLNMFYSKRQLIDNFMQYNEDDHIYHNRQDLKIIEETREEDYPVLEDSAGTHVFRSHVLQSLTQIKTLEPYLDYLVVDTLFKDDAYALSILPMYQNRKPDQLVIDQIQKDYQEIWDEGFFFKKTIYKQKG